MQNSHNELHFRNWQSRFENLIKPANHIKILTPFINQIALETLGKKSRECHVRLLTKYDLDNFLAGISDLATLQGLFDMGVEIRGIKHLHSKVYILDDACAVVSSSNLTQGGFVNNFECGVIIREESNVVELTRYFDELWADGKPLTTDLVKEWNHKISERKAQGHKVPPRLGDDGGTAKGKASTQGHGASNTQHLGYLKFWGKSEIRLSRNIPIREVLEITEAYYACTFPTGKRPRGIKTGDQIYMTYMVTDPPGYKIFGKATAYKYVEERDDASKDERSRKPWKNDYPHYIRVHSPVFIDAKLEDCPELSVIMDKFGVNVFRATQQKAAKGKKDINIRFSLRQQPGVWLTCEATAELDNQFSSAIAKHGKIPDGFIAKLPPPTPVKIALP